VCRSNAFTDLFSLIFWALMLIVTVKYVLLLMSADDEGEGGTMALISQIRKLGDDVSARRKLLLAGLGVFGAGLFFGDSMITLAISVLSAVEGWRRSSRRWTRSSSRSR